MRAVNKTPKEERLANIAKAIAKVERKREIEILNLRRASYVWPRHQEGYEGNMKKLISTSVIWFTVVVAAQAQLGDIQSLKHLYDYDQKQPLDTKETLLFEREGATVYNISYASPKGGRVTAFLVVPAGEGPFAGLVFGHWGPGNRTEFLPVFYPDRDSKEDTVDGLQSAAAAFVRGARNNHGWRQLRCINLIPSENTPSELVRWASELDPCGRYAEHQKAGFEELYYYQGTDWIEAVEEKLHREMRLIFGCAKKL